MNQYEKLDSLILDKIKDGAREFANIDTQDVHLEALRLQGETSKPAFRHIDSRLQALRRKGLIEFKRPGGWAVVEKPQEHNTPGASS